MTTKIEIKGALITLAKVWGIKNHSIESEDNTFTLIDKASGTVAKNMSATKKKSTSQLWMTCTKSFGPTN